MADYATALQRSRELRQGLPSADNDLARALEISREIRSRQPFEVAPAPLTENAPVPDWARRYEGLTDVQAAANTQAQGGDVAHVISGGLIEGVPVVGPAIRAGADRVGAGIRSVLPGGKPYEEELADVQGRSAALKEEFPQTHGAAQVAGGVASVGGVAGIVPKAAATAFGVTQTSRLAGAGVGATTGATLTALDQIVREAIETGEVSAPDPVAVGLGAAGGALGSVVGRVAGQRAAVAKQRSTVDIAGVERPGESIGRVTQMATERAPVERIPDVLGAQARRSYRAAQRAGFSVSPDDLNGSLIGLRRRLTDEGFNHGIHPGMSSVLRAADNLADNRAHASLSLRQLDAFRQQLGGVAQDFNNPSQQRLARIAIEHLDNFVQTRPSPSGAVEAITKARRLWHIRGKAQILTNALSNAEISPSNTVTAIRTAFRPLLRNSAQKLRRAGFTQDEIAAVRSIARAEGIDAMLSTFGKLGPGSVVSLGMTAGTGFITHGPLGAVVAPMIAAGASRVAGRVVQSRAENVIRDVARGGAPRPMDAKAGARAAGATVGSLFGVGGQ